MADPWSSTCVEAEPWDSPIVPNVVLGTGFLVFEEDEEAGDGSLASMTPPFGIK